MLIPNANKRDFLNKELCAASIEPPELKFQEKLISIFDNTDEDVVSFLSYLGSNHLENMDGNLGLLLSN